MGFFVPALPPKQAIVSWLFFLNILGKYGQRVYTRKKGVAAQLPAPCRQIQILRAVFGVWHFRQLFWRTFEKVGCSLAKGNARTKTCEVPKNMLNRPR